MAFLPHPYDVLPDIIPIVQNTRLYPQAVISSLLVGLVTNYLASYTANNPPNTGFDFFVRPANTVCSFITGDSDKENGKTASIVQIAEICQLLLLMLHLLMS